MIDRKNPQEIALMREGGNTLGNILLKLLEEAKPGISLKHIDDMATDLIRKAGGSPSFMTVEGYKWATCLCVNDVVVHGIPTTYVLQEGDLLTIDVGMLYKGFHTDTAWTKIIQGTKKETQQKEKEKFLKVGEEALWNAVSQAKVGNRIGHVSHAIQEIIEGAGYSIVKTLVGHGVGRTLHEDPQIPGFLHRSIETTQEFVGGETIAIEVIYAMRKGVVVYSNDDGWTIATRDGSLSAVFEHTVLVAKEGTEVLTRV